MSIDRPVMLWLLLAILPVAALMWRGYVRGSRDLRLLTGRRADTTLGNLYIVKWFFGSFSLILFLVFGVAAASGFRWGQTPVPETTSGEEVMLLIDVSRSMLAQDIQPSRLKRAAAVCDAVVQRMPGVSFGITVFKGKGSLVVPSTEDTVSLTSFLDEIDVGLLTSPGTDIEAGINTALGAFAGSSEERRVILLFTDGGFLSGNPVRAAAEAAKDGVQLFIVGSATTNPVPIPLADGSYVVDAQGATVTTSLRTDVIAGMAQAAGEPWYRLDDPQIVSKLVSAITGKTAGQPVGFMFTATDHYRGFLLLALFWLGIGVAIRVIRWKEVF